MGVGAQQDRGPLQSVGAWGLAFGSGRLRESWSLGRAGSCRQTVRTQVQDDPSEGHPAGHAHPQASLLSRTDTAGGRFLLPCPPAPPLGKANGTVKENI